MAGKADTKLSIQEKLSSKYSGLSVSFAVDDQTDPGKMGEMGKVFERVGISMKQSGNHVSFFVDPLKYGKTVREFAGADKVVAMKVDESPGGLVERPYYYSDIVMMKIDGKTHDQIIEEIGMKRATYFRHYKEMIGSKWYATINWERANDEEYLWNHRGNGIF